MVISTDICPKSGLKREVKYISFTDNLELKHIKILCNIKYYNKDTDEYLGDNIFGNLEFILTNDDVIDGIGQYDYWKGSLNDVSLLISKGFNSFDVYISYIILKIFLKNKLT